MVNIKIVGDRSHTTMWVRTRLVHVYSSRSHIVLHLWLQLKRPCAVLFVCVHQSTCD